MLLRVQTTTLKRIVESSSLFWKPYQLEMPRRKSTRNHTPSQPETTTEQEPNKKRRITNDITRDDDESQVVQEKPRCFWAGTNDENMIQYHDHEWGRYQNNRSDRDLFEFLILEGAQAGLSWSTILNKRDGYRELFENFEIEKVAHFDEAKIQELLLNPGIVRNKAKVRSAVGNAKVAIDICTEFGSLDTYFQSFMLASDEPPRINRWKGPSDIPVKTEVSDTISKDLKKRGMKFVGPTIMYAFMQAVGYVNDHTTNCFLHPDNTSAP